MSNTIQDKLQEMSYVKMNSFFDTTKRHTPLHKLLTEKGFFLLNGKAKKVEDYMGVEIELPLHNGIMNKYIIRHIDLSKDELQMLSNNKTSRSKEPIYAKLSEISYSLPNIKRSKKVAK